MFKANLPNKPIEMYYQRASDSILYTIDCCELLDKFELITKTSSIYSSRSRKGTIIEVRVGPDLVIQGEYQDFLVNVSFETTTNNIRSIQFKVRVYK